MQRAAALFLLALATVSSAEEVQIRFSLESIGVIRKAGQKAPIGTGFVLGESRAVVTADHVVAARGRYTYQAVREGSPEIPLSVRSRFPGSDLAVLELAPESELDGDPFQLGDLFRLAPGDTVVYLGWNAPKNKVALREAVISAVGKASYLGTTVDFLEFIGEGIPGWSGGPVLDLEGKVVAVMHEAWTKRGVKGGKTVLVNRAFSAGVLGEAEKGSRATPSFGVVERHGTLLCLAAEGDVAPGESLHLVFPQEPQSWATARVVARYSSECEAAQASSSHFTSSTSPATLELHRLRAATDLANAPFPAIGVVGAPTAPINAGDRVTMDLGKDGMPETFRACTSKEGLHLSAWSGATGGRRLWHQ